MRTLLDMVREVKRRNWRESKLRGSEGSYASDGVVCSIILPITVINTQATGSGQMCCPMNYMLREC